MLIVSGMFSTSLLGSWIWVILPLLMKGKTCLQANGFLLLLPAGLTLSFSAISVPLVPAVFLLRWLGGGHTQGGGGGVQLFWWCFPFFSWETGSWVITVSLFKHFDMSSTFHNKWYKKVFFERKTQGVGVWIDRWINRSPKITQIHRKIKSMVKKEMSKSDWPFNKWCWKKSNNRSLSHTWQ